VARLPLPASAFALYALIHCGVPADHPARQRVLAFLLEGEPTHTYGVSTLLMALCATGDPVHADRTEDLHERLLDLRANGGWDYPGFSNPPDL
jgi:hypothetical protein